MREFVYLAAVAAMAAVVSGDVPQVCPDDGLWYLPNQFDCTKYYRCYMGKPFEFPCLEDTTGKQLCFVDGHTYCGRWDNCTCIRDRACKSPEDDHKWMNPADGHGYYQCQNGTVVWVSCKDNEELDQPTLTCRPKPDQNQCPPSGSGEVVRYPHHCLCQYYYECKDGKLTQQECPGGQLFDADLLTCRSAEDTRCNGKPTLCPKDGTFPSDDTCYEYYTCENGVKTTRKCPARLIFDNVKLLCVPWDQGNCSSGDVTPPPVTCEDWESSRKPNWKDCNRYYECINGNVENRKCLENHYYNEKTLLCDRKENVQCKDGKSNNEDCPPIDCGTVRFPHQNCEWYYECQNGRKVSIKCATGLGYNKDTDMCDLASNVKCEIPGCPFGKVVPHECQCNMYYICNNKGEKEVGTCPPGKNFDEVTLNCTLPEYAKCHKEHAQKTASFSQTLSYWLH
ncbi:peritrophin-48 [Halictus rubicundus]|uniref:peritrophin-48 n=1 Tax=Halictus rubicundus TaxID=77578 RepID=UPI00403647CD